MSITDLVTDVSHTPAECYVYRKRDIQILALQRSAMCGKTTYRSSGAEAPSRFDAMTYCSSGARVCLLSMVLGSSTLNPGYP